MRRRAGFTLTELLVVVSIIGILATAAVPQYTKTVERTYLRETETLLITIYAGQQVYFSTNNAYFDADAPFPPRWNLIFMDNPNLPMIPVTFTVGVAGSGTSATFTATATRNGGAWNGSTRTIDQTRTYGGTWPGCLGI